MKNILLLFFFTLITSFSLQAQEPPACIETHMFSNETYFLWDNEFGLYSITSHSLKGLRFDYLNRDEADQVITTLHKIYYKWEHDGDLRYRNSLDGVKTYVVTREGIIIGEIIEGYGFRPLLYNPNKRI